MTAPYTRLSLPLLDETRREIGISFPAPIMGVAESPDIRALQLASDPPDGGPNPSQFLEFRLEGGSVLLAPRGQCVRMSIDAFIALTSSLISLRETTAIEIHYVILHYGGTSAPPKWDVFIMGIRGRQQLGGRISLLLVDGRPVRIDPDPSMSVLHRAQIRAAAYLPDHDNGYLNVETQFGGYTMNLPPRFDRHACERSRPAEIHNGHHGLMVVPSVAAPVRSHLPLCPTLTCGGTTL